MFTVRRYEAEDRPGLAEVRSVVWRGGGPVGEEERLLRDDCSAYVVESNGKIVGSATLLDMTCSLGESDLRCAGIAAVGILPEMRGTGAGSALMRGVVQGAREDGFAIASLYPYRETWYRRFGFEVCASRLEFECPAERLPKFSDTLPVQRMAKLDLGVLDRIRRAFQRRYSGYNSRTPDQWWRASGGDSTFAIYTVGEPACGYMTVRPQTAFWGKVEVQDMVWEHGEAHRALLAHLHSLCVNQSSVTWLEPCDSPTWMLYRDQGLEMRHSRPLQYRVLNVETCLRALGSGAPGAVAIDDPLLPGSCGTWNTAAARLTQEPPTAMLGIGAFTQAILGSPALAEIARYEDQALDEALALSFPARSCYCDDFF